MSTTATKREQLEQLATEMRTYADAADAKEGGATLEDQTKLLEMAARFASTKKAFENERAITSALGDTSSFLGSLSEVPDSVVKSAADVKPINGAAAPTAKTWGEMFV